MAENKKYWYLQLNVNFFEDERIDWLAEQQNGYAYVVLYLKLCLKTANNNGILTRQIGDMIIPYDVNKIAEITKMNVDIVRVALELYKKIGLVYEADENCNFMRLPEVPSMVGYTTQYAIDKAKYREKKKQLALDTPQDTEQTIVQDIQQDTTPDNEQDIVRQELRVKSKELRVKNNKKSKSKKATSVADTPTLQELEQRFSNSLANAVLDWLTYKTQRGDSYTPLSLKALLTRIENNANENGEQAVINLIQLCIENSWKGIIWDKLKKDSYNANTQNTGNPFADALIESQAKGDDPF